MPAAVYALLIPLAHQANVHTSMQTLHLCADSAGCYLGNRL